MQGVEIQTKTAQETRAAARELGKMYREAGNPFEDRAYILALRGDLGAGKTTFAQGFAQGLGITKTIQSPTFVLMKRFPLKKRAQAARPFGALYHLDCYRLESARDLASLKLSRVLYDPQNIVLIEWPERAGKALPRPFTKIRFKVLREGGRSITIMDHAMKHVFPRL